MWRRRGAWVLRCLTVVQRRYLCTMLVRDALVARYSVIAIFCDGCHCFSELVRI